MSSRIGDDLGRFKDIIKGRVKNDLKRFVNSQDLIGQQGNKRIKIPIHTIDLPRFSFGGRGTGGPGMGNGDVGDPMDGQGRPGQGEAGDGRGDGGLDAEFSPDELAQIMIDHLELPNIENKGKGEIHSEKSKYNQINNNGPEGLRHFKRTYKEALKRSISSGTYNPHDPVVIPIKNDKRYKSYQEQPAPDVNTVVIYMMDCSGSMGTEQKKIVSAEVFWIELLLKKFYKGIESVFIVHDTEAREVSRKDFYRVKSSGGTRISSAYQLCDEVIKKRFPFTEWNVYPFHFSDGDNFGGNDNDKCAEILTELIIPNCNVFSYGQVRSAFGSGEFMGHLAEKFSNNDKVTLSQIDGSDDILKSIKQFFEKGK